MSYNILSRPTHNIKFNAFKALGAHNGYFDGGSNILIPQVGLKFLDAFKYVIESNFNIQLNGILMLNLCT